MSSGERSDDQQPREAADWSDQLLYGSDSDVPVPEFEDESDHWSLWHYGIYLGAVLLLLGLVRSSLVPLVAGYLLVPITMHLDSRYLESVTPMWEADTGLYVIGSLLFPVLLIPIYLYRRRELRSTG
jgi:hypothetical protein